MSEAACAKKQGQHDFDKEFLDTMVRSSLV